MNPVLKIIIGCVVTGLLLGDSIAAFKEGRYRNFGIDLMLFIIGFASLITMTVFGLLG